MMAGEEPLEQEHLLIQDLLLERNVMEEPDELAERPTKLVRKYKCRNKWDIPSYWTNGIRLYFGDIWY